MSIKQIAEVVCAGLQEQNDGRGPWIPFNTIKPDQESFIANCLTMDRAQRPTVTISFFFL